MTLNVPPGEAAILTIAAVIAIVCVIVSLWPKRENNDRQ